MSEQQSFEKETTPRASRLRIAVILVFVAVLFGAAYALFGDKVDIGKSLSAPDKDTSAALVNGEEISMAAYERHYKEIETAMSAEGQDTLSPEAKNTLKEQTLNNLVAETLVLQEAKKEGLSVSEDIVLSVIEQNRASFPDKEAFKLALDARGLTIDTFRSLVIGQLLVQKYISAHINLNAVSASEEEVNALYNQLALANADTPSLAAVRSSIENEIKRQKQQQLISALIQELKNKSTIEILI